MQRRLRGSAEQIAEVRAAHAAELEELKRSQFALLQLLLSDDATSFSDSEKQKLLKAISHLKAYRSGNEEASQLRADLESARHKNRELESRLADYEERMQLIHGLSRKESEGEGTSLCPKTDDDEDDQDHEGDQTEDLKKTPQKPSEAERVLPFSFAKSRSREKTDQAFGRDRTSLGADSQPCEPGLDSEEFRQFLKRRREERICQRPYKFVDVVRCREDRTKLEAFECADCKSFYACLNEAQSRRKCSHGRTTPKNLGDRARKVGGRHRATFRPPRTPPGFWDLDFPDSIERKKKEAAADAV